LHVVVSFFGAGSCPAAFAASMLIAMMAIGTRHPRAATPIATPLQPSLTAFRKARARCMVVPYTIRPPPRPRQARQHPVSRPAIVVATPACSERSETTWQASTHEETDKTTWQASTHEKTDKARTLRTKHGPLGCRGGIALARGRYRRVLSDSHFCFPPGGTFPTAERSVLCPQCPCFVRFFICVITRIGCLP